jgi:hypothetical protein
MQSTGVYWIPLYDLLEQEGFEVYLVNARDTKDLPGRKSDVQESQWLLKLHTYGLLRNSFHPSSALTQMNPQLANVISDIMGVTGRRFCGPFLRANEMRKYWRRRAMSAFGQRLRATAGYVWIYGSDADFLGRYHRNSNGILGVRYSF